MSSNEHNYLLLYKRNFKQYQPTSRWCKNAQYKVDELLCPKDKSKFVPETILHDSRKFIRDNF
jgi:hypothetical protein